MASRATLIIILPDMPFARIRLCRRAKNIPGALVANNLKSTTRASLALTRVKDGRLASSLRGSTLWYLARGCLILLGGTDIAFLGMAFGAAVARCLVNKTCALFVETSKVLALGQGAVDGWFCERRDRCQLCEHVSAPHLFWTLLAICEFSHASRARTTRWDHSHAAHLWAIAFAASFFINKEAAAIHATALVFGTAGVGATERGSGAAW